MATLKPRPIQATYDRLDWRNGNRGMPSNWPMFYVHQQITVGWDKLESGDHIDVSDAPRPTDQTE